jgi:Antitoxin Phd_YefM, type II toxin-antitoxin system
LRTVGLLEANQKFSEIVERAAEGERIGITRRGKAKCFTDSETSPFASSFCQLSFFANCHSERSEESAFA